MKRKEVMRGVYDLGVTLGAGEMRPCCVAAAPQPPSSLWASGPQTPIGCNSTPLQAGVCRRIHQPLTSPWGLRKARTQAQSGQAACCTYMPGKHAIAFTGHDVAVGLHALASANAAGGADIAQRLDAQPA